MTTFEIIILVLIYCFCYGYAAKILETEDERLGKVIAEDLAAMMDAALSNVAKITYTITVTEYEKDE